MLFTKNKNLGQTNCDANISCAIYTSFDKISELQEDWDSFVASVNGDIYFTFDWCRLWWKYYGENRQLQLLLFFSSNKIVGLIPAFVETLWLGAARIRAAKLIGSDFSLQFCNPPIVANTLDKVVSLTIKHFLGVQQCDIFIAGPLSAPPDRITRMLSAGQNEQDLVGSAESQSKFCATSFEFPGNFEQYLSKIGSKHREQYRRKLKLFSKNHQVMTDTISEHSSLLREFDQFHSLHQAQWSSEGKLGHFGDWPKATDFNRDLVDCFGKKGMVRFFRILADNQVASSQFCFLYGHTNYWRLPARACNPDWEKLSLGKMGLIQMFKTSIAEGITTIEGGRCHYDYKVQLGGHEFPLHTIMFIRRGLSATLRVRLFRASASLLHLVYYKLFFTRLATKFPILKRSLWPVWIRSTWQ